MTSRNVSVAKNLPGGSGAASFSSLVPSGVSLEPRRLFCQGCRCWVHVFEAAHGARTDAEHRYLNADDYWCGSCGGFAAGDGVEVLP